MNKSENTQAIPDQRPEAIARDIGDRRGEASHCWNLGTLHEETDPAHAAVLMQVCVDFEREIGHPDAEADAKWVRTLRTRAARARQDEENEAHDNPTT